MPDNGSRAPPPLPASSPERRPTPKWVYFMSDTTIQLTAIGVYFAGMLVIGIYASRRTRDLGDYMLAGRRLPSGVAAISAGASDMSGWLLMGLPGAIYLAGLIDAWIAIGLVIGAWLNWTYVAPRLRVYTELAGNAITVPSYFQKRLRDPSAGLRILSAVAILVFFTFYVSAGMVAAGKFFESSFGWPYVVGMMVVGAITLLYTMLGGFLGASLTDVVQGLLMLFALIAVPLVALFTLGGPEAIGRGIVEARPEAFNLFSGIEVAPLAWVIATISTMAWGLGYFGQPHIIVRFMAMRSPHGARTGRRIGISWMLLSCVGAIAAALVGLGVYGGSGGGLGDPETVFLGLSQQVFPPILAGLVLAAVLAAIMSTISSQLIVCSSALVEDLYRLRRGAAPEAGAKLVRLGRVGVFIVAVIAGLIALDRDSTVLELVAFAWAGFGATFGPLVLLSLYWPRLTARGAMWGLATGGVTVFAWAWTPVLAGAMYAIVPGFLVNLLVAALVSRAGHRRAGAEDRARNSEIQEEYAGMLERVRGR